MSCLTNDYFEKEHSFDLTKVIISEIGNQNNSIQYTKILSITVKFDLTDCKLKIFPTNIDFTTYYREIYGPLNGLKNDQFVVGQSTKNRRISITGIDINAEYKVRIVTTLLPFFCEDIEHLTVTLPTQKTPVEQHIHYLYKYNKESNIFSTTDTIQISNLEYPIVIQMEHVSNTPFSLNCLSLINELKEETGFLEKTVLEYYAVSLSFLLGSELNYFGYSKYDSAGNISEWQLKTPRTDHLRNTTFFSYPPIYFENSLQAQDTLGPLCSTFLSELNDADWKLAVEGLLHRMWSSRSVFLDYSLILVYSGLEIFMKNWSTTYGYKKKTETIISKEIYDSLISPYLCDLKSYIENMPELSREQKNKYYEKIGSFNINQSSNHLSKMYESVGFPFFNDELKRMRKERDELTHSKPFIMDEDVLENVILYCTALTLCNQTLLAYLGYSGQYVDYGENAKKYSS